MSGLEITDYADRFLTDRFSTVPGVARVRISGARRYAMRIWLDREALAAHGLTVADVESSAARRERRAAGRAAGVAAARVHAAHRDGFRRPRRTFARWSSGGAPTGQLVRLGEVAEVRIGAENERSIARANGIAAVSLAIEQLSNGQHRRGFARRARRNGRACTDDLPDGMRLASTTTAPSSSRPRCTRSTRRCFSPSCWC